MSNRRNPLIIAHRGAARPVSHPENTLAAFRRARIVAADWVELDVRRTRDGQLVCLHDDTVTRTTDGTGKVAELSLREVRLLDLEQW